jgi:hypothetical protein
MTRTDSDIRSIENRVQLWNGTVHYAEAGRPACGAAQQTASSWMNPTLATVTCERCIAQFGADEPGHEDPAPAVDEHVARRAEERAARRLEREERFYVASLSVGSAGLTERPTVVDRKFGRQVKVFRSNERSLAETMARALNDDEAKPERELRAKAADYRVLDRFDTLRSRAGHDYGAGQRTRELRNLRRELEGYGLRLAEEDRTLVEPLTPAELRAAFDRVSAPKIARLEAEAYRAHTPATTRTRETWERLANELTILELDDETVDHYELSDEQLDEQIRRSKIEQGSNFRVDDDGRVFLGDEELELEELRSLVSEATLRRNARVGLREVQA